MNLKNLKHIIKEEISRIKEQGPRPPKGRIPSKEELISAVENSDMKPNDKHVVLMVLIGLLALHDLTSSSPPDDEDSSSTP